MRPLIISLVVGLSPRDLEHMPKLKALSLTGFAAPLEPVFPALTCSVQATLLTGLAPDQTGIVGNGWYFKDLCEVKFWHQSNCLVRGEKLWETARKHDPKIKTAKLFWWYNMHSSADYSVTPRPAYLVDGRKIPDIYTQPPGLRTRLNQQLGRFPLFQFWGPATTIASTQWIVDCALSVLETEKPELTLVYLPHLDYNLQRLGPGDLRLVQDFQEIDEQVGRLIQFAEAKSYDLVVVSEYGITKVDRPIHVNRILRDNGLIRTQLLLDRWELLDCGACEAFSVADHQIAHVYVKNAKTIPKVAQILEQVPGIETVLYGSQRKQLSMTHPRAGDILLLADERSWFTYYYWENEAKAPDFARCVDIHKKPGYDPAELFFDPQRSFVKAHIAMRWLQKILGFRSSIDVIGTDASLVKGSHGRLPDSEEQGPMVLSNRPNWQIDRLKAIDFKAWILKHWLGIDPNS